MTDQHIFAQGDRVDIVIRGAEVVCHDELELQYYLPGRELDLGVVPLTDDDGGPLAAVSVMPALPQPRPGDVWRATRSGWLLFAVDRLGEVIFVTQDNLPTTVEDAVRVYGVLDLELNGEVAGKPDEPNELQDALPPPVTPVFDEVRGPLGPPHPNQPEAWSAFDLPRRRPGAALALPAAAAEPAAPEPATPGDAQSIAVFPAVREEQEATR